MTINDFINDNREAIDQHIRKQLAPITDLVCDDDERELWVMNDETLYNWARDEGVDV